MRGRETREASGTARDGFLAAVAGDGTPLLLVTAASLVLAGGFVIFLAASGEFLPHDIRYLGMSAADLCSIADCRIVEFMVHDRAAFGGALFAVGVLYAYLVLFPAPPGAGLGMVAAGDQRHRRVRELPGLPRLRLPGHLARPRDRPAAARLRPRPVALAAPGRAPPAEPPGAPGGTRPPRPAAAAPGRPGLPAAGSRGDGGRRADHPLGGAHRHLRSRGPRLHGAVGGAAAGLSPRLGPLMAHDRAGFGGAVFTLGLTTFGCLWCAPPTRALWEAILVAGGVALAAALGVHGFVGYTDLWHLTPALAAAAALALGLALTAPTRPEA